MQIPNNMKSNRNIFFYIKYYCPAGEIWVHSLTSHNTVWDCLLVNEMCLEKKKYIFAAAKVLDLVF